METGKNKKILNGAGFSFKTGYLRLLLLITVFFNLLPLSMFGQDSSVALRTPIDINLIIDSSSAYTTVKSEVTAWILKCMDQILEDGDRVTIWSAGAAAKIIYTGRINSVSDKEDVKKNINDISGTGNSADFSGALREAAGRQSSALNYTLLISASPSSLSALLSGSQSNLLRFSRVEDFSGWRALVVGLDIEQKVKKAAAIYFGF
jgi:hypothetical protein